MKDNSEERLAFWRQKLQEYRKSGLSRNAFCERNGLKKSTLDYWFARISKLKKVVGLVEVRPTSLVIPNGSLQIMVAGKYRIEVRGGFDPHLLCEVVKALEALR